MKKHTRVLTIIFGILLLLAAAGFMVLQLPSVQTGIANYATEKLKEITDADISISKIQIKPLSAIVLRDVCILDTNPYIPDENSLRQYDPVDTLFSASAVSARIDISSLLTMEPIKFGNATVDNGHLHLTVEPDSVYGVNLTRIFRIPKSNEELSQKDIFLIRTINVNNFRFSLTSFAPFGPMRSLEPQEINWENFSVRTNVEGRDLHFSDGRMSGVAEKVELWQDKGFHCRQVEGQALVGRGKAIITDIYAVEDNSTVHLDTLTFSYRDASDFSDFINKVHIRGRASETRPSLFAMKTLRFFAPGFSANRCVANVKSLIVDGYVSDLHVTNFNVRDTLSGISALIEASCTKLPEIGNNDVEASIRNMSFTPERLEKFISGFTGYHPGLDKTLPRGFYTLNSHTSGNLNNLRENAAINSTLGKVNVTSSVRNTANGKPLEVQALLNARALDLGAIFKSAALGRCDIDALGMNLTTGRDIFNLRIDSLQIASLRFLQHDFKNLYASGSMDGENISATMTAGDSALLMNLEAESTAGNGSGPDKYKVHGKVYDADLHAFGVNVHKGESRIAFGIDGAMSILKEGSRHNGRLYLSNVELKDSAKVYQLGGIQTGYISYGEEKHIDMDSGFLEAHLSTDRSFNQLVPDFSEMTLAQAFPSVFSENIREQEDFGYCDLSVKTGYTREILDFLFPSMFIEKGTSLSVVSDTDGSMDAEFSSGRIIVGGIHGKGLYMDLNNKSGALSANMVSDELKLAGISLKDTRLNAEAADDNFDLNLFLSQLDHEENNIRAVVEGSLSKDENGKLELNASPLNSSITLAGEEWRFSDAPIRWNSDGIHIDQLTMDCNQQHIRMNGGVSRNVTDTLTIFMQNFDLTTVDQLTNGVYGLDGTVSADVIYISPLASDNTKLTLGVLCEDLTIDGVNAGTVLVDSRWDDRRNKMEFTLQNSIEHFQAINAHGDYRPSDRYVNASLELDSLNVAIAGPFFKNVFSEMGGSLSGTVEASGPLNKIKISSKGTRFNDTMLRIAYTGVPYHFNGPFEINQKGIVCKKVQVSDFEGVKATLDGGLLHEHLQDFALDATLNFRDMEMMNSGVAPGRTIYGKLFASGHAHITGPISDIAIDAAARATRTGNLTIGSSGPDLMENNGLLTFAVYEEIDEDLREFEAKTAVEKSRRSGNVSVKARFNINPDITINMEIDPVSGSGMSANGNGNLSIEADMSSGLPIDMRGNYDISSGKFHFAMPSIVNKDFLLLEGSRINFAGDVANTVLDVNALYKVSTTLSTIIADSTSTNIRRHVNCGIHVTDKLSAPKIGLSIDVPDLDPTTKSQVESALNTEDKIQKQFVALLLFGTFIPNEQSGVVNGSNILYSNLSEIMMNQVNNVLQKLNIPVDLGFGYQQSNSGNDVFDVAVSTQLFNNRVIVNGSVGNRKYKTSTNPGGDIVGDLDIEIKLDNPGHLRFNLFSHSADEFANYMDLSQRNGVGITYQRDFNNLADFFKKLFSRRKKDGSLQAMPPKKEPVVITVE